jgi:hypothetical protein
VSSFLNCAISVVWSLVVVVAVSPGVLAAILPLSLSYYYIQVWVGGGGSPHSCAGGVPLARGWHPAQQHLVYREGSFSGCCWLQRACLCPPGCPLPPDPLHPLLPRDQAPGQPGPQPHFRVRMQSPVQPCFVLWGSCRASLGAAAVLCRELSGAFVLACGLN